VTGEAATTDESGRAQFSALTLSGVPGPRDVTFSAAGLQSVTARVTLLSVSTVQVVPSHPQSAVVGTRLDGPVITYTFRDAGGRPVPDADFSLELPSGSTVDAPQVSDQFGVVQLSNWTLSTTAGYQVIVLELPDGREFRDSILALPDAPTSVLVASGDDQTATAGQNLPQPLVARVVDRHGNGVPDVPVQWATCDGAAGPTVPSDAGGYSSVTQPTSQPTDAGCTRASISAEVFADFSYTVTAAPSEEGSPTGVSAAAAPRATVPPVPLRER
ncbi:MAG TPA: hypothetical protein VD930_08660, partial [Gemmatimonadales bacterium]|nr:hypothetical protein [Gemmatimonadales bacterium]